MADTDWPSDPDSDEGSEGMRKYGQAILAKKLDEEEDFPLRAEDFVAEHGDEPIRVNYKQVVSVADIFEHVEEEAFESIIDFHTATGRAMRRADYWNFRPDGEDPV
ncbi:DUF5785 family protein [Halomarina ordinaria]|uniref:DUF5785 family protein n=1 Tax=Halomarina ordinaria TaxID=3033939 RepID=A0ABD5U9F5_9EURY|nr:DUF5785 family protein [Halomarina sp. PSRA2]